MNLKPGPELDALVAEKVMQWKKDTSLTNVWYTTDIHQSVLLDFSTSIEAAWEVVEKITTEWGGQNDTGTTGFGLGFQLFYREEHSEEFYEAIFVSTCCAPPYENMRDVGTGKSKSAPHAICLAALKAVGVI